MKIAILGFGVEVRAAFDYWNTKDNKITICDQNKSAEIPHGTHSKLGDNYLSDLSEYDLIVRTAGLNPTEIIKANSPEIVEKITTINNEFFRVVPTKNIIGVTGTKGKGTTSTLITKLLEASGKTVHFGGNVGVGTLGLLKQNISPSDWVVLELSSYQLTDLKYSPHISVCLMIVPEHLNWHLDMQDYINSKRNIFNYQTADDIAIYYADNPYSSALAQSSPGVKIPYLTAPGAYVKENNILIDDVVVCSTTEVQLIGEHNLQNICAAITAYWQIDKNIDTVRKVITSFRGLEHRIELVRQLNGIFYYNDSYASVPDATIAAIEAIKTDKVVIIGGFDRNLDLTDLANTIKKHQNDITKVILIGQSAMRTAKSLSEAEYDNFQISTATGMGEVIALANSFAKQGNSVVLSPGFPSFDMFKNFEDRGNQFKTLVNSL